MGESKSNPTIESKVFKKAQSVLLATLLVVNPLLLMYESTRDGWQASKVVLDESCNRGAMPATIKDGQMEISQKILEQAEICAKIIFKIKADRIIDRINTVSETSDISKLEEVIQEEISQWTSGKKQYVKEENWVDWTRFVLFGDSGLRVDDVNLEGNNPTQVYNYLLFRLTKEQTAKDSDPENRLNYQYSSAIIQNIENRIQNIQEYVRGQLWGQIISSALRRANQIYQNDQLFNKDFNKFNGTNYNQETRNRFQVLRVLNLSLRWNFMLEMMTNIDRRFDHRYKAQYTPLNIDQKIQTREGRSISWNYTQNGQKLGKVYFPLVTFQPDLSQKTHEQMAIHNRQNGFLNLSYATNEQHRYNINWYIMRSHPYGGGRSRVEIFLPDRDDKKTVVGNFFYAFDHFGKDRGSQRQYAKYLPGGESKGGDYHIYSVEQVGPASIFDTYNKFDTKRSDRSRSFYSCKRIALTEKDESLNRVIGDQECSEYSAAWTAKAQKLFVLAAASYRDLRGYVDETQKNFGSYTPESPDILRCWWYCNDYKFDPSTKSFIDRYRLGHPIPMLLNRQLLNLGIQPLQKVDESILKPHFDAIMKIIADEVIEPILEALTPVLVGIMFDLMGMVIGNITAAYIDDMAIASGRAVVGKGKGRLSPLEVDDLIKRTGKFNSKIAGAADDTIKVHELGKVKTRSGGHTIYRVQSSRHLDMEFATSDVFVIRNSDNNLLHSVKIQSRRQRFWKSEEAIQRYISKNPKLAQKLGVKIDKPFYTCSPVLSQVPQTTVEKIYAFTGQLVNIALAIEPAEAKCPPTYIDEKGNKITEKEYDEIVAKGGKAEKYELGKQTSKEYTERFKEKMAKLTDEERLEFEKLTGVEVERVLKNDTTLGQNKLDVNHRLPADILSDKEKLAALKKIGINDINDPRVMDLLDVSANRGQHKNLWKKELEAARITNQRAGKGADLTDQQILEIWQDVEKQTPYRYELPNAVQPEGYINKK